ncbi:MAG TPA: hypothetical protein VIY28_02810 [Pseudonocardiaceae bacterium]
MLLALTQLVACGTAAIDTAGTAASGAEPDSTSFGTLASLPAHSAEEAHAGVSIAEVEIDWIRAEPSEGNFDEEYLQSVRDRVATFRSAGRTITLEPSLHYTPKWLLNKPDGRMVDDLGNVSDAGNFIFNQKLREAAEKYLAKVGSEFDFSRMTAVRVTSATDTEVLYPANGHYWAFDRDAQNGPNMPPTMAPNPAPGWRPGQDGLTEAKVRQWADWYVGALNDEVNWQLATYAKLGFRGTYLVLTPGVGVLPKEYNDAVSQNLPPGLLGAGGAWQVFYSRLPRRPDVVAYVSSAADNSGDNDSCEPADQAVPLDSPDIQDWSATRWITRLAHEYGFAVAGENPGWHQSHSLDKSYRDLSDSGMMATALRQARTCNFKTFYWAHDEKLWDGTVPFSAYAEHIAR